MKQGFECNYECKASITLVLALLCYNELIYISDDIKVCLISLWENMKTTHLAIQYFFHLINIYFHIYVKYCNRYNSAILKLFQPSPVFIQFLISHIISVRDLASNVKNIFQSHL